MLSLKYMNVYIFFLTQTNNCSTKQKKRKKKKQVLKFFPTTRSTTLKKKKTLFPKTLLFLKSTTTTAAPIGLKDSETSWNSHSQSQIPKPQNNGNNVGSDCFTWGSTTWKTKFQTQI